MSRPPKYHDPQQRILDVARSLIVQKGFDGVSLRAIARAADFSPASLYAYFDGKGELMNALAQEANQALAAALREALLGSVLSDPDSLIILGLAYIEFARTEPERFLLLFSRNRSARRSLNEDVPSDSAYAIVINIVNACLRAGTLRETPHGELLAYGLWSAAHGAAMLQLTTLEGFDADFDAGDEMMLENIVAGMRP